VETDSNDQRAATHGQQIRKMSAYDEETLKKDERVFVPPDFSTGFFKSTLRTLVSPPVLADIHVTQNTRLQSMRKCLPLHNLFVRSNNLFNVSKNKHTFALGHNTVWNLSPCFNNAFMENMSHLT
jgi:hypothetical protein